MRKYGNMFRAGDCPNDSLNNRLRTLDIRLLSGNSAVHSDMLMWHTTEPVERAALYIINIIFAVPQISMRLDQLPLAHREMLTFWLTFWRKNQELLLAGEIRPLHPETGYSIVYINTLNRELVVVYAADTIVRLPGMLKPDLTIINGTLTSQITLELSQDIALCDLEIINCLDEPVEKKLLEVTSGLQQLTVPPAGLVNLIMTPTLLE